MLVALQYVHVLSLIDLIVISILRLDHNSKTCFCHYSVETEYASACMSTARYTSDVYIGIMWATVLMALLFGICYKCWSRCST